MELREKGKKGKAVHFAEIDGPASDRYLNFPTVTVLLTAPLSRSLSKHSDNIIPKERICTISQLWWEYSSPYKCIPMIIWLLANFQLFIFKKNSEQGSYPVNRGFKLSFLYGVSIYILCYVVCIPPTPSIVRIMLLKCILK